MFISAAIIVLIQRNWDIYHRDNCHNWPGGSLTTTQSDSLISGWVFTGYIHCKDRTIPNCLWPCRCRDCSRRKCWSICHLLRSKAEPKQKSQIAYVSFQANWKCRHIVTSIQNKCAVQLIGHTSLVYHSVFPGECPHLEGEACQPLSLGCWQALGYSRAPSN